MTADYYIKLSFTLTILSTTGFLVQNIFMIKEMETLIAFFVF